MPTLSRRSSRCCLALLMLGLAGTGCGKRLRGVELAEQVLLRGGKSVFQEADGIEAMVTPVRVPWSSKDSPIGFAVELTNLTGGQVYLAVGEVELHDSAGRILEPLPPDRLLRSFGIEVGDPSSVQTVGYRHRHGRRYVYRRHYPRYRRYRGYGYDYYWTTGWSVGVLGFGGYADPYAEQRETARFLSELLTDQMVAPQHVAYGHVVFAHRLEDDQQLTLVIRVVHQSAPPASQPAEPAEEADGEAGRVTSLAFRFEVD